MIEGFFIYVTLEDKYLVHSPEVENSTEDLVWLKNKVDNIKFNEDPISKNFYIEIGTNKR